MGMHMTDTQTDRWTDSYTVSHGHSRTHASPYAHTTRSHNHTPQHTCKEALVPLHALYTGVRPHTTTHTPRTTCTPHAHTIHTYHTHTTHTHHTCVTPSLSPGCAGYISQRDHQWLRSLRPYRVGGTFGDLLCLQCQVVPHKVRLEAANGTNTLPCGVTHCCNPYTSLLNGVCM